MSDPYIDQYETLIYGLFARDQMLEVCLGRQKQLDSMVRFAISTQEQADAAMKDVLDRHPRSAAPLDPAPILAEARDVIVRFGSHLDSLKGHPVNPKSFFGNDAPSVLARRRLTKLTAAVAHILDEANRQKDKLGNPKAWIAELEDVHQKLVPLDKQQRATKVSRTELTPEIAAARTAWLDIYAANKLLIRGLLGHVGKEDLLPLIFDDLAEVHRTSGTTDDPAPPIAPVTPLGPDVVAQKPLGN